MIIHCFSRVQVEQESSDSTHTNYARAAHGDSAEEKSEPGVSQDQ